MPQSVTQVRKRNLLAQFAIFSQKDIEISGVKGLSSRFAQVLEVHNTLLSRLFGEGKASRDISDKLARQIEVHLNLPLGWLDAEHEDAPNTSAEDSIMDLALTAYRSTNAAGRSQIRKFLKGFL